MKNIPVLQPPTIRWGCDRCPAQDETREARPHTRFHHCPALGGAVVPMVQAGDRLLLVEREDYIGQETVQLINDRPVMAAVTEHPDGRTDAAVFAPTATASTQ